MDLLEELPKAKNDRIKGQKYLYKNEGKKNEGCFNFDNKNNIVVNQEEFNKRFDKLVEKIDYYLENGSEKDIECIKLFYDT